jgi:phosphoenolpyruvate carboxykinase (ATP)
VVEPTPNFSPCFGGPFLTLHPRRYAELLGQKLEKHKSRVYMINTGWCGGPYGIGERISLPLTRRIINAVMDGSIDNKGYATEPHFGLSIPVAVEGVPAEIIDPSQGWSDAQAYTDQAAKLARMFEENHEKYHY